MKDDNYEATGNDVTLFVADLAPFADADVRVRTFQYRRKKKVLTNVAGNDEPDAPQGLRRIPESKLPAVGGPFGLTAAATTREDAIAALIRVAEKERDAAAERVRVLTAGIEKLKML